LAYEFAEHSLEGLELWHSLAEQGPDRTRDGQQRLSLRGLRPQFLEQAPRSGAYSKGELL
jgi:hypothetical protein